jgi:hypothetical protein
LSRPPDLQTADLAQRNVHLFSTRHTLSASPESLAAKLSRNSRRREAHLVYRPETLFGENTSLTAKLSSN